MVDIGRKIDEYAQKYNTQLRAQENKTGHRINKYDVAQYMLSQGVLNSADLNNWLKTSEGLKNKNESEQLKKMPVWQAAQAFHGGTYLDSVSEFSIGSIMGFEKTQTGQIKATKSHQKFKTPKQQLEEQKLKQHLDSLPEVKGNPIEMTKKIDAQAEAEKIAHMSIKERKEYIMGKFLDAKNKNDKQGMYSAVEEFFSYECSVIDDKLGINAAKDFVKNKSGLNNLVDYIDKAIDDNNDDNLSSGEIAWNIVKGVGDTIDGFIGSQGIMMIGTIGGATKAAAALPKGGKLITGGIQAFFGVEGTKLVFEGAVDVADGIKEDDGAKVRQGSSEASMGAIMTAGARKSVKEVANKLKVNAQEEILTISESEVNAKNYNTSENIAETSPKDTKIQPVKSYIISVRTNDGSIYKVKSPVQNPTREYLQQAINSLLEKKRMINNTKDIREFKNAHFYRAFQNSPGYIRSRMLDLEVAIKNLEEGKVKDYVYKKLSEMNNSPYVLKKFLEIETLIDAYNESANNYVHYQDIYKMEVKGEKKFVGVKSDAAKFNRFRKNGESEIDIRLERYADKNGGLLTMEYRKELIDKDDISSQRMYSTKKYIKEYPNSEMSEYLYDEYLSKRFSKSKFPELKQQLLDINKKYGVKLFIPSKYSVQRIKKTLSFVVEELNSWQIISNGKAKMPPIIDFNTAKANWYDPGNAYGQSAAAAFSEYATGSLAFHDMNKSTVKYSMRHELTHTNDLTRNSAKIPDKYNLDEIMPKKTIIKNGKEVKVPDFEHCMYVDEFLRAGISEKHISYAYNSPAEFIAVASEGNMAMYSPEFKQVLIDFGMPEWELNLAPNE